MPTVKFAKGMFIEHVELNRFGTLFDLLNKNILFQVTDNFGIMKLVRNPNALSIYEAPTGYVGVRSGAALDEDANFILVESDTPNLLLVPNDGTTRKVFIQFASSQIEEGTITVATNGTITGLNTEFLKLFTIGKKIVIIDSVLGNNGVYTLDGVSTDTSIHTSDVITAAEGGLHFKVQSRFTPSYSAPAEDLLPYYYDSFLLTLEATSAVETDSKFLLAQVTRTAGVLTIVDSRTKWHAFKRLYLPYIENAFTTATSFKVGTDQAGVGGRFVKLVEPVPNVPKNIRIFDIDSADKISQRVDEMEGLIVKSIEEGDGRSKASVVLKWNWDDILGIGGNGTFTVTNSFDRRVWTANELVDYVLQIAGVLYRIVTNTPTASGQSVLSVTNYDGTAANLTGIIVNAKPYAFITVDADYYECVTQTTNKDNSDDQEDQSQTIVFAKDNLVVRPVERRELFIGKKYRFRVRSVKGNAYSNWVEMVADSTGFVKAAPFVSPNPYTIPFIVRIPNITSTGTFALTTAANGFDILIVGWLGASAFEICYTTENAGADFNNKNHPKFITAEKSFNVPTPVARLYNVKVRPLVAGQQVATAVSFNVLSGSSIQESDSRVMGPISVLLKTYAGRMSMPATGIYSLAAIPGTVFNTPAGTVDFGNSIPESIVGGILVCNATCCTKHLDIGTGLTLKVNDTESFSTIAPSAFVWKIIDGVLQAHEVGYTGKTSTTLTGVSTDTVIHAGDLITSIDTLKEFVIQELIETTKVRLVNVNGQTGSPTVGSYVVNVSKRGRRIFVSRSLPTDIQLTRVTFDCNAILGSNQAILRWYQDGVEAQGDLMGIDANDTAFEKDTTVIVSSSSGVRDLVADLYLAGNDNGSYTLNHVGLVGILSFQYRPYV